MRKTEEVIAELSATYGVDFSKSNKEFGLPNDISEEFVPMVQKIISEKRLLLATLIASRSVANDIVRDLRAASSTLTNAYGAVKSVDEADVAGLHVNQNCLCWLSEAGMQIEEVISIVNGVARTSKTIDEVNSEINFLDAVCKYLECANEIEAYTYAFCEAPSKFKKKLVRENARLANTILENRNIINACKKTYVDVLPDVIRFINNTADMYEPLACAIKAVKKRIDKGAVIDTSDFKSFMSNQRIDAFVKAV